MILNQCYRVFIGLNAHRRLFKKKCVDQPIEGLSYKELLPFDDDDDIDEVLCALMEKGMDVTSFLPFVSEDALHDVTQSYIDGKISQFPESFLPFMDEDDIRLLFQYELKKKHV